MISVTRNTHIASVTDSFCCSSDSKWCCCAGCTADCGLDKLDLLVRASDYLLVVVLVRPMVYHRRGHEVLGRRRRAGVPLEADGPPRIGAAALAVADRP